MGGSISKISPISLFQNDNILVRPLFQYFAIWLFRYLVISLFGYFATSLFHRIPLADELFDEALDDFDHLLISINKHWQKETVKSLKCWSPEREEN